MYGKNSPFGLRPCVHQNGDTWNGQLNEYPIASGYATSLFTNDPVSLLADGTIGIGIIGGAIIGVFQGVKFVDSTGYNQITSYWTGGTVTQNGAVAMAQVCDDPSVLYDIQVATATGAPGPVAAVGLALTNFNQNANFAVVANSYNAVTGPQGVYTPAPNPGAGSKITGLSGYYLDFGSLNVTATLNLKLVRLTPVIDPGQVYFSAGPPTVGVFNNALVRINNNSYSGGTGTAGV